ncbi:hypothetical protein B0A50_07771 [Salinomyces thailandicus]|uniref:Mediator of RNA polymerase II transcription subunit 6 n=1 Tax=Salinomyces thailandicus TaxID=706561 RepID=A0A4U0TL66_9PEZI|nr:hypothetical protein B0A50_07771 [Salinomyces thailandica]
MARPPEPLDEQVSRRPDVLDWWLNASDNGLAFPRYPMEERFIHRYFSETPFFDWTSKEGLIISQAGGDWNTFAKVNDRAAFEALLRQRPGVEYGVVGDAVQIPGAPEGVRMAKHGVWVVRKVDRMESEGRGRGGRSEEAYGRTELLGTYYVVGENVYMAPSIGDVVGNRLLSAATSLERYFEKVAALPSFSPTSGYSYLPQAQQKNSGTASVTASPARSREGSVAPGADMQTLRSRSGSLIPDSQSDSGPKTSSARTQDARLLAQALQLSIQFGDEYTDENPMQGEPGAFKFTSSTAAVKKRKADEEAATAAQKAKEAAAMATPVGSPSPVVKEEKEKVKVSAPTPPAVFSDAKTGQGAAAGKLRKEERKKRKKSKGGIGTSPTTPVSGTGSTPGSAVTGAAG